MTPALAYAGQESPAVKHALVPHTAPHVMTPPRHTTAAQEKVLHSGLQTKMAIKRACKDAARTMITPRPRALPVLACRAACTAASFSSGARPARTSWIPAASATRFALTALSPAQRHSASSELLLPAISLHLTAHFKRGKNV